MRKTNEILESLTVSYGADLSRKLVALQGDSFISEEASIDRTKSICINFNVLLFGPPAIQSSQFRKGFCHCHNGLNLKKGGALTGKQLWSTRWNEEIRKLKNGRWDDIEMHSTSALHYRIAGARRRSVLFRRLTVGSLRSVPPVNARQAIKAQSSCNDRI